MKGGWLYGRDYLFWKGAGLVIDVEGKQVSDFFAYGTSSGLQVELSLVLIDFGT